MMATYTVDTLEPTKANFQRLVDNFKKLQKQNADLELINNVASHCIEEYNHIRSLLAFRIWGVGAPVGNLQIMKRLEEEWKTQEEIDRNNESITETKTTPATKYVRKSPNKSNTGAARTD